DRTARASQRVQRARTGHVGAQAGEQRLAAGGQLSRSGADGIVERGAAAIDRGRHRHAAAGKALKAAARTRAVAALQRQRLVVVADLNLKVIASQCAEWTD